MGRQLLANSLLISANNCVHRLIGCPCAKLGQLFLNIRMRPQEIIARKRDGGSLSEEQIKSFIDGVCDGGWADYQVSALLMAMFVRGLDESEQDTLTQAMLHSGTILDLSAIEAPKADKHSTGGVGDKTSLIIAPLVAACGLAVPMISGRALGHTGGTLDKLESIPGYNVNLTTDEFRKIIKKCGFAMSGQTADIAPADKKLYALRDATATVPYIPLIVASIMSKKLAEGLDALVLDVKTGSGAFMSDPVDSERLAKALVRTGTEFGVRTQAVISDMGQPLGRFAGNSLEIYECLRILRAEVDEGSERCRELSLELASRMLLLGGLGDNLQTCRTLVESKLSDGSALERLRENIELQGGDAAICGRPEMLLASGIEKIEVPASASGFVAEVDTFKVGRIISDLGGGRGRAEDAIDPAVGLEVCVKIGDHVEEGQLLCVVYSRDGDAGNPVVASLATAFGLSEVLAEVPGLVRGVVE
jgi:pyrimidine-nucleoside phosphorylase